jgi:hypothetical protein
MQIQLEKYILLFPMFKKEKIMITFSVKSIKYINNLSIASTSFHYSFKILNLAQDKASLFLQISALRLSFDTLDMD